MIDSATIARLSALATRCRELAETAADPDAAATLRQTALDLEALMALLNGTIRGESRRLGDV